MDARKSLMQTNVVEAPTYEAVQPTAPVGIKQYLEGIGLVVSAAVVLVGLGTGITYLPLSGWVHALGILFCAGGAFLFVGYLGWLGLHLWEDVRQRRVETDDKRATTQARLLQARLVHNGTLGVYVDDVSGSVLDIGTAHARAIAEGSMATQVSLLDALQPAVKQVVSVLSKQEMAQISGPRAVSLPQRGAPFSAMQHCITAQQEVLGWDGTQWITASPEYTLSVGIVGKPGSGKTSLDRYFTAMALKRGAEISGWDMHGDIVRELGSAFSILDDPRDIVDDAAWIISEIDRRTALYKLVYKHRDPEAIEQWSTLPELFHMIDEFTALMTVLKSDKKSTALCRDALLRLITEGRKLKMRTVISGQSLPAEIFGGSGARDNLQTRYAFGAEPEQARMLGIPESAIADLLPLVGGDDSKGYAVLCGGPLKSAVIVSVPWTTVDDIRAVMPPVVESALPEQRSLVPELHSAELQRTTWTAQWSEPVPEVTADFNEWFDLCTERVPGADTASWEFYWHYCQRCINAGVEPISSGDFAKELKRAAESAGCKANNNSGLKRDGSRGQRSGWTGLSLKSE